MAAAAGGGRRPWVLDVEKNLGEADASVEVSRWQRHSIYRVPACIKDLKPKAYKPQVVSLGPFHHGDPELVPMEEHKRRALRHLLRRAKRPLEDFVAAVDDIAEPLESAYLDLGAEWRGAGAGGGRERFLEVMIVDGCFLLEVMRAAGLDGRNTAAVDYAPNDPIFSHHGVLYMVPYIRRDMLMLENQLPLILLEKLVAVETGKPTNGDVINRMVLRFLTPTPRLATSGVGIGLHALDVHRRNMLYGHYQHRSPRQVPETDIIRSAVELYEAGIRFRRSSSESLHDIRFRHGELSMPAVTVDDSTEYMFLNMMAFERLHVGAGNDVTAYVFFMDNIIDSAKDVALLSSKGIIQNAVGSDKAVAKLFNSISKDVVLEPESALDAVHREVNAYCRKPWNMWRANLIHTYFRSPWAFLSLAAAVFLLVMTIMQTVYTVLPYYQPSGGSADGGSPAAPAPM
ncbi:hypothetical protein BDA96_05G156300 [Sorghum bicolor]|uniref:Uncharacterized protein n=3 Tax=Sorghum bicolor TaxID=4558 RepID=C5Y3V0_SORBI|nr:hypothetical protein SORBI_3005G142600 [Sorghum bicolor]KAG0530105.1 hypothetical protein BDA96_05G156300 [Sorghum bicolor]